LIFYPFPEWPWWTSSDSNLILIFIDRLLVPCNTPEKREHNSKKIIWSYIKFWENTIISIIFEFCQTLSVLIKFQCSYLWTSSYKFWKKSNKICNSMFLMQKYRENRLQIISSQFLFINLTFSSNQVIKMTGLHCFRLFCQGKSLYRFNYHCHFI